MSSVEYEIGAIIYRNEPITLHPGFKREVMKVRHCGDRPIQIGSHYHFFEVNKLLQFPRERAYGMHLDILSGTAVRFEPGEEKEVQLVEYGGERELIGFSGLTMGSVCNELIKVSAVALARDKGFLFSEEQGDPHAG